MALEELFIHKAPMNVLRGEQTALTPLLGLHSLETATQAPSTWIKVRNISIECHERLENFTDVFLSMAKRKECQPINTVLTTAPKKMLARNCSFRAWKIHFGTWELLSPVIPSRRSIFGPPGKMSSFLRACLIIYPSQMCSAVIDSSLPRHQEHLPMDPSCTRAQVTMTGCAHNCCYLDNIKYKYIYKHSTNTNGIIILKQLWSVGLAPQCLAALYSSKSELWRKWFLNLHKPRFFWFLYNSPHKKCPWIFRVKTPKSR